MRELTISVVGGISYVHLQDKEPKPLSAIQGIVFITTIEQGAERL